MTGFAELHRHLDGSLRRETLCALAAPLGIEVPAEVGFFPGMGLAAALERFALTLSVLQTPDAVKRVAAEMCEDARAEGITWLEIRFAPQLHTRQGARVESIVDAALDGLTQDAGLILCGLYGESPEVLRELVEVARTRPGVVGLDLAGGPSSGDRWRLEDYAEVFALARDVGLGRTVHAGEGRPPEEIRTAIEVLHANRVGHGTTLLEDPAVVEVVLERGVTLEACPTSNMQVGAIGAVDEHPLPRWLALGVRACVCTDNTLFSAVDAPEEHRRAGAIPGMTAALIAQAIEHAHEAAFRRR